MRIVNALIIQNPERDGDIWPVKGMLSRDEAVGKGLIVCQQQLMIEYGMEIDLEPSPVTPCAWNKDKDDSKGYKISVTARKKNNYEKLGERIAYILEMEVEE